MYSNLKNIKGFLQCYKKRYFIHVNCSVNNKSEAIAHELGHYFLHKVYSKEELVAEMGAAMLCGVAGIDNSTIENSASYIDSWLRALKKDSRLVLQAASHAQKASDTILGETKDEPTEEN
jgi:antirestriction protein ArdC